MAFDHLGGHFGEPIVEDRPLVTSPFGMAINQPGGHFGEPIVEDRPLVTRPLEMALEPIVEASCLGTGSFEVTLKKL